MLSVLNIHGKYIYGNVSSRKYMHIQGLPERYVQTMYNQFVNFIHMCQPFHTLLQSPVHVLDLSPFVFRIKIWSKPHLLTSQKLFSVLRCSHMLAGTSKPRMRGGFKSRSTPNMLLWILAKSTLQAMGNLREESADVACKHHHVHHFDCNGPLSKQWKFDQPSPLSVWSSAYCSCLSSIQINNS